MLFAVRFSFVSRAFEIEFVVHFYVTWKKIVHDNDADMLSLFFDAVEPLKNRLLECSRAVFVYHRISEEEYADFVEHS